MNIFEPITYLLMLYIASKPISVLFNTKYNNSHYSSCLKEYTNNNSEVDKKSNG